MLDDNSRMDSLLRMTVEVIHLLVWRLLFICVLSLDGFEVNAIIVYLNAYIVYFQYQDFVSGFFPPVELALGIPSLIGTTIFVVLLARAFYLVRKDRKEDCLENN